MKQVALYAVFPLLLAACGNDEPRPEPIPQNPTEQADPNKGEQAGDKDKTNKNNPKTGDKPAEGGEDNKPKGEDSKPNPQAELNQEELNAYLGGLNPHWGIPKVREQIKLIGALKEINGKAIKITNIQITDEQPNEGKFTLRVQAEVAGQALERSFEYTGFAKTPQNYYLAKNMDADWRVAKEVYTKDFALDKLYEDKDVALFTAEYLARFVNFYSSDFTTSRYILSSEEIKDIKILDINYRDGAIRFKTEYKGVKSDREIRLQLSQIDYYSNKLSIDNSTAGKYYAEGVAEHADMYLTQFVDYDSERYYHEGVSAQSSDAGETVHFRVKLYAKKGELFLGKIEKTVKGFRSLSQLAKDMTIAGNYEVNQRLGRLVGNLQGGDALKTKLNLSIDNWIKEASILIDNQRLGWRENYQPGAGTTPILSTGTRISNLHLLFKHPRFQVVEARREDNFLYVKFRILTINDLSFNNLKLETESKFHLIKE